MVTVVKRFLDKIIIVGSGCWEWQAAKNNIGYGVFHFKKLVLAHRFSYEYYHGEITVGLVIDHKCNNRACVNPEHLQEITQKANLLRGNTLQGINSRKTQCSKGHPYDYVDSNGGRRCKKCWYESMGKTLRH